MSQIYLNKRQGAKIHPHLSGRAATARPLADDKQTLEVILFVLTQDVDGPIFRENTAAIPQHDEDSGDGHGMEPLPMTCASFCAGIQGKV